MGMSSMAFRSLRTVILIDRDDAEMDGDSSQRELLAAL